MRLVQHMLRGLPGHVVAAVTVAGLGLALLGGCAGAGSSGSMSTAEHGAAAQPVSGGAPKAADGRASQVGEPGSTSGESGEATTRDSSSAGVSVAALEQRRQVRTAQLAVRVKDVDSAVSSARAFATAAQGFVSDEQTATSTVNPPDADTSRPTGAGDRVTNPPEVVVSSSVLTVRVPQQSLDRVMGQVAGLGDVLSRSQSSQDVTGTYVDVSSRVKSQRASVERVRTLLSRATGIGDVVRLESELSRREADLESLEARLAALDDSTTLATLVVSFNRPDVVVAATPTTHDGFVGGLRDGWHALGTSTAVVLRVVGALIPFGVLLALIALPVWLVLRRRRRQAPAPTA